jgi:hypothetical protein
LPSHKSPSTEAEAKGLSEVTLATLGENLGVGIDDVLVQRSAEGRDAKVGEVGVQTESTGAATDAHRAYDAAQRVASQ